MNAFPPEDIRGFLQLCAGEWLSLRSLLDPDTTEEMDPREQLEPREENEERPDATQKWHQADRGELKVAFLEADAHRNCGGLDIGLPSGDRVQLNFQNDGTVLLAGTLGRWRLTTYGTLELQTEREGRRVKERIWFSKPNLRLRCTLEQAADGSPGRASFSSEIRRIRPPVDAAAPAKA